MLKPISTIEGLLGHTHITTTQRYCKVSNITVQRDYYNAIEVIMQRSQRRDDGIEQGWIYGKEKASSPHIHPYGCGDERC
jgi:hypothetical protein